MWIAHGEELVIWIAIYFWPIDGMKSTKRYWPCPDWAPHVNSARS